MSYSSSSSHRHRRESRGSSSSSSASTPWSTWEWSGDRKRWEACRINSRGVTEWRFENDQSTSTSSANALVPRFDDTSQLDTVSEDTTQYSIEQNYTTDNKDVGALTDSLDSTSLVPVAEADPPIVAKLKPNNTSTEHRNFDPNYKVHVAREFGFGRVFKVLWSEPTGNARGGTMVSVRKKLGEEIHAKVRRFVVVDPRKGHCLCLPIMTYEGRATNKPGVHADEHAIIFTTSEPMLVKHEDGSKMKYRPVKMIPDSNKHKLEAASRINYHKVYTVEYNVKVWFIGRIDPGSRRAVTECYDQAHPPLSRSTQALTPSSYPSNPAYSSSSYSYGDTMPSSAPNYGGTGYNIDPSNSNQYGGYSTTGQPAPTQYPPAQYPPTQYPPTQYLPLQYPPSQYPSSQYLPYTSNEDQGWDHDSSDTYGAGRGGGQQ
ncbi:uncharacterized protein EAF01_007969 [Botrytis porri]|uniref:DUF6590 domain-containing protein n=1 Tax=Botrytis porri TaxID=87229 RepID=A0A4Z1KLF4_9HELO|nr:uncharacterized protein EAF01_007969 [Botrytis porri]KAF7900667.1 hypothetical protein EAF01_007969 [Botrytis porri]TGO84414.1 hypothetical protein BPOR_0507g00050 [Botrytis porri]